MKDIEQIEKDKTYNDLLNEYATGNENVIAFEPDYDDIKNDPNKMWFKYHENILYIALKIGHNKLFDYMELMQQAYIDFIKFCSKYDPYYNGNFIPFEKYICKNLIFTMRSQIQRYYFKLNRELPDDFQVDLSKTNANGNNKIDDTKKLEKIMFKPAEKDDAFEIDYQRFLDALPDDRIRQIVILYQDGYKQWEIGQMIGVKQSNVSVRKTELVETIIKIINGEYVDLRVKQLYKNATDIIEPYVKNSIMNFKRTQKTDNKVIQQKYLEKKYGKPKHKYNKKGRN